ncbi:MAG: peptidoglycan editing factor PgeF [Deltaproteobacteria bacterium]|nr:peptidoglycan editing factor PgeF [Deltaproteobacteria bacterium]
MIELFKSDLLTNAGFTMHGYTKRRGGVSEGSFSSLNLSYDVGDDPECVSKNLARLKSTLNVDVPLARVKQVHGNRVVDAFELAASWTESPNVEADGIVSKDMDIVIAVQNADCAPVLLADPVTGTVAAIHAGWRGAARRVIRSGIQAMIEKGANKENILVAIGPCACGKCYEVGDDVAKHFPESADPIKGKPGKYLLDLGLAIEVSLLGAGLLGGNIDRIDACSIHTEEVFSVRRDGSKTGRFLGFILGRA